MELKKLNFIRNFCRLISRRSSPVEDIREIMIVVNKNDFISSGDRRDCYRHPTNGRLCIKILKSCRNARVQQNREVKFYRKLSRSHGKLKHIAKYFGSVRTNLGLGYVYELVRDFDGNTSQTIAEALNSPGTDMTALYDDLEALLHWLRKEAIVVCDINSVNIMVQKEDFTRSRLVIIDGIGDVVAFPILNLLPAAVDRKIVRRWQRSDLVRRAVA